MAFTIDDIRRFLKDSSMLMRLIIINVVVFVLMKVLATVGWLFYADGLSLMQWLEMPSDLWQLLKHPWTLLTYMFAHASVLHILFNMLWLYWMGSIFMEFFSSKHLTGLYLLGGWGGAALFLLAYNLLPRLANGPDSFLVGSSAAVIAIVVATALYAPDYKIGILFLGEVALKWVAIVTVLFVVLSLDTGDVGASIAHLGGAAVGAWFTLRIKQGHDITRPLNAAIDALVGTFNGRSLPKFKKRRDGQRQSQGQTQSHGQPQPQGTTQNAAPRRPDGQVSEEELDKILSKIKAAGYDALTDEERDKLFKASKRR